MFDASNDLGLDVTNCILKDGTVILEFRTFGTKNGSQSDVASNGDSGHLLGSHPNKSGLPQRVVNGVGVFHVGDGCITQQHLYWDQDMHWFHDMNVIKMPQTSTISHLLHQQRPPILNLSDTQMESGSSNGSDIADGGVAGHNPTVNGDDDDEVMFEMGDEMSELLALRGLNISDLQQNESIKARRYKEKQMAKAIFWLAVGAMFVIVAPKYLGKKR